MTKLLGLFFAAFCAAVGLGQSASAQGTLQATAVALAPNVGLLTTLSDGVQIGSGAIYYSDLGGSCSANSACPDLFLYPTAGPDPSVIIEAADGTTVGSTLVPILSYACGAATCSNVGGYDLTVYLTAKTTGAAPGLTSASVTLADGPLTTPGLASEVGGSETLYSSSSELCTLYANAAGSASPTSCSFSPLTGLAAQKDFGLHIFSLSNGETLQLSSITESFAVPEPAPLASLLCGIMALAALRGMRRRHF